MSETLYLANNLTVIIPTYNRPIDLQRLLTSLFNQTSKINEILVIVGPGDVKTNLILNTWITKLPLLRILHATKPSVVHALNIGLSNAKEDIICLLDDDVWLPSDWADKIKAAYKSDNSLGAYGGRDYLQLEDPRFSNPVQALVVGTFRWDGALIGNHHCGITHSPAKVDVLKGVNLSFRRSSFPTMQIDLGLEGKGAETCWEIDICLSIKKLNYKVIYDNNNYVFHYGSPRLTYDDRNDLFSPAWPGRIFNETLVMVKFRSTFEVLAFLIRSFFLGSRAQPGIFWSVLLLPKYGWRIVTLLHQKMIFLSRGMLYGLQRYKHSD